MPRKKTCSLPSICRGILESFNLILSLDIDPIYLSRPYTERDSSFSCPFNVIIWPTVFFNSTILSAALLRWQSEFPDCPVFSMSFRTSWKWKRRNEINVWQLPMKWSQRALLTFRSTAWTWYVTNAPCFRVVAVLSKYIWASISSLLGPRIFTIVPGNFGIAWCHAFNFKTGEVRGTFCIYLDCKTPVSCTVAQEVSALNNK